MTLVLIIINNNSLVITELQVGGVLRGPANWSPPTSIPTTHVLIADDIIRVCLWEGLWVLNASCINFVSVGILGGQLSMQRSVNTYMYVHS